MAGFSKPLAEIWEQNDIPVLFNRGKDENERAIRPWVKTPYGRDGYSFIKLTKSEPEWSDKRQCYKVPSTWFNELVKKLLSEFGRLYIIQPYREREICSLSCKMAKGHDCSCQCFGQNHGSEYAGNDWFFISDACEIRWGEKSWAHRLLESREQILLQAAVLV